MTFNLLNQLGLSGIDYSYLFIGLAGTSLVLLIIIIILIIKVAGLKKKYIKFMGGGKDIKSLEEHIERIFKENNYIKNLSEENKKEIRKINKEMEYTFNKIGIVKYDAFKQMGGNLSFSICLVNEKNDGFILNSVHSTEGCYTYIKEVKAGICELELSNEEKDALTKAMKK